MTTEQKFRPLHDFESLEELVAGIVDAVKAHESLYMEAGILHRDINEGSIVLGTPGDISRGFLINLEMAVILSDQDKELAAQVALKTRSRTHPSIADLEKEFLDLRSHKNTEERTAEISKRAGTVPYMAIDILWGVDARHPHTFYHDLESFFYVLYLSLFTYDGPKSKPQPWPEEIQAWCGGTFSSMAAQKRRLMTDSETALTPLFYDGPSYWRENYDRIRDVIHLIHHTHDVIFASQDVPTHADFYRPLEQWLSGEWRRELSTQN
ncbi:hypothetical protein BOTBODRAFT_58508 [Botryobasidium botryosum FD-172 SS1]|uniref:Protein kinase domain-containing protein n=1 Tax=Botryobasidium botryosum (strain FD-172 SS1) TaxID=930990 RepID=A0A067M1V3_BOTB1|nr:hypothetical protein BOTBODRAFT_58508 [Botryobasidium botryosum FD-172 SS1]